MFTYIVWQLSLDRANTDDVDTNKYHGNESAVHYDGFCLNGRTFFTRSMPKDRNAGAQKCTVGLVVKYTCSRPDILYRKMSIISRLAMHRKNTD